jgi:hypothetical protein
MNLSKTNVLTVLLLVSLFANLALLGMLGGKYAAHSGSKRNESAVSKLIGELPSELRAKVDAINAPLAQELSKKRKELRQQREQINMLLTRPKVGRAKWEAAYANYRKIADDIQKLQHKMAINAIMAMSPEERETVADEQKAKDAAPKKQGTNKHHKQTKKKD